MPLISFGTDIFFDFNTNTTADNFYICVGVDHKFTPGEFKTSAKFMQKDGFEKFRSLKTEVEGQLLIAGIEIAEDNESTGDLVANIASTPSADDDDLPGLSEEEFAGLSDEDLHLLGLLT